MRFLLPIFLAFVLAGCASKEIKVIEYVEVKVPVKCQIDFPKKPQKPSGTAEKSRALVIYLKELENALKFCIEGSN